jgi:hypothetical protein
VSQKRFWCHENQRLAKWESNLAPQNVEIVCWCRAIGNLKYTNSKKFQYLITSLSTEQYKIVLTLSKAFSERNMITNV